MTVPNPFIQIAVDPVGTAGWIGYGLFLTAFVLLSTGWGLRKIGDLGTKYRRNHHTDEWWSGPFDIGIVPPASWTATLAAVLFVWSFTAWAGGALVWLVG